MKKQIRKEILLMREAMDSKEVDLKSQLVFERLIATGIYKKSNNIFTYLNFRNEVKTNKIINHIMQNNKNIYIPLCNTSIKEIIICKMDNWEDVETGTFGILEPKPGTIKISNRKHIDLVIVPGIVFDIKGNRIGYGAGYYDKFFSSLKKEILKIGICYSFQIVKSLPASPHDIPMDYIITEKEIINCK